MRTLERCRLGVFPTPLRELPRLSQLLAGPRLWIKRDDLTGLALGGNKTRKLEYLLADAQARHCDCVLTAGAAQSNHCRQTAAAAAALGLPCHLVLGGKRPAAVNGNLLLDQLLGAEIHWAGAARKGEELPALEEELRARGFNPCVIPYGGSNRLGAAGFVAAMVELDAQLKAAQLEADAIVFASSSGGTQAGLMVGSAITGRASRLLGISIDKEGERPLLEKISDLARETADLLEIDAPLPDPVLLTDYTGGGYGVVGTLERETIRLMGRSEGILLDPVYTGRAFGALLDLIEKGAFSPRENVIFWHTGGTPALFAEPSSLFVQPGD